MATTGHFIADAAVIAIRAAASADQEGAAEKVLTIAEQAVREDNADLPITTGATFEPAGEALVKLSRTARLVVVGCDDVNPAAALLLGSTSLVASTGATCPVVVWRGNAVPDTRSVVVGVDGTVAGRAALAAAFESADRFKAPLKAVHAWTTARPADQMLLPYLIDWDAVETAERAVLSDAVDQLSPRYPDVDVQMFVEQAKPGRALMRHLDDAQLVVVGNHRRNAFAAAMLGSTSLNLLHHSGVPVMVCHAVEAAER